MPCEAEAGTETEMGTETEISVPPRPPRLSGYFIQKQIPMPLRHPTPI